MATRVNRQERLYQLKVTVDAEAEEAAGFVVEDLFAQWPVSYSEAESNLTELSLFLPPDQRPSPGQLAELGVRLRALTAMGIQVGTPRVRLTSLASRNWKESWKRHFKPREIGGRLLLRPSWSKHKAKPGQSVVVLDPGLSFGTGQHATTSFCLQELVRARSKGDQQSFLDVGTGSGILAIAAAKLGYTPVHGFDNDPESVRVASTNARRNRVDRRIRFRKQDLSKLPLHPRQKYDVVCANLLADLLRAQASRILNQVKPGGVLVIAGILSGEFGEVDDTFSSLGARPMRARTKGEWRSGSYQIPGRVDISEQD